MIKHRDTSSEALLTPTAKVELLRTSLEETQKYELLTTNQYLKQIELVIEILKDISLNTLQALRL